MSKSKVVLPLIFVLTLGMSITFATDWLQFSFSPDKSGVNTEESQINISNVSKLTHLFTVPLMNADNPDGAPVLLTGVRTASGVRDLIFVQGEHGTITAYDANSGTVVWSKTFGTGGTSNTAPAIDPNRQFIYVDGNDARLHKLNVGDGTEVTNIPVGGGKGGSQLTIAVAANGHTYVYDAKHGQGHIVTWDTTAGTVHVFNTSCSQFPDVPNPAGCTSTGARPWARGNPYIAELDRFLFMNGNNNGNPWNGCNMWKESWLAIPADGSTHLVGNCGFPLDSWTGTDVVTTVSQDRDIGTGGCLIVRGFSSKFPLICVNAGKDARIRIINLMNMSGQGGPGHQGGQLLQLSYPTGSLMRAQSAVWTDPGGHVWVFVVGNSGTHGFTVDADAAGNPILTNHWNIQNGWTTSAVVANGVLFTAADGGEHTGTGAVHQVQAINPTTGTILWTGATELFHWASPIVVNGTVYFAGGNSGGFAGPGGHLFAWRLTGGPTPTPTPVITPTPTPTPTPVITPTPTPTPTPVITPTPTPTPTPSATPTPTPTGCVTTTAPLVFTHQSFASQTGTFTATFSAKVTGTAGTINNVIALSDGSQSNLANDPVIISFSDTGHFVARNAGVYTDSALLNYIPGVTYQFSVPVDVVHGIYSVVVTPPGAGPVVIANGFHFRTGVTAPMLNSVGSEVDLAGSRSTIQYCNFAIH